MSPLESIADLYDLQQCLTLRAAALFAVVALPVVFGLRRLARARNERAVGVEADVTMPLQPYDVVIVGGGMSGVSCPHAGVKVLFGCSQVLRAVCSRLA